MLYFQDESGVSLTPVLGKTWAKKGKTPKIKVTGNKGGFCVTSAISPAGRMVFRIEKEIIPVGGVAYVVLEVGLPLEPFKILGGYGFLLIGCF